MSHQSLYGSLRAAVIARRFAIDRGRRVYLFSEEGQIFHRVVDAQGNESNALWVRADYDTLDNASKQAERDAVLARWNALSATEKLAARERSAERNGENPWLRFAPMAVALACEQRLGLSAARPILGSALTALAAMFRCPAPFDGYPIRWDPVASEPGKEHWSGGTMRSGEFPLDAQGRYDFTGRSNDERAHRWRSAGVLAHLLPPGPGRDGQAEAMYAHHRMFQQWEPSQDEVFGMLTLLWASGVVSGDTGLRGQAVAIGDRLGRYLARHAYLLVKPGGGLVPRGHGDSLVGAEFAIGELFASLLNQRHSASTDWPGAMQLAGLWPSLRTAWDVGTVSGGALNLLSFVIAGAGAAANGLLNAATLAQIATLAPDPFLGVKLGRMLGVMTVSDLFDTYRHGEGSIDPALSAFFREYTDPAQRFAVFMHVMAAAGVDAPASGFVPFVGLFGLDTADTRVRDTYLAWFWPRAGMATRHFPLFALAAACVLAGDGRWETELRDRLDAERDALQAAFGGELPFAVKGHDLTGHRPALIEEAARACDYLGALALAWWHHKRRADAGQSTVPGFPAFDPSAPAWPRPGFSGMGDLFPNDTAPPRAQEGPTGPEDQPDTLLAPQIDQMCSVAANAGDVDTGVDIHFGDVLLIEPGSSSVHFPWETWTPIRAAGFQTPRMLDAGWPVFEAIEPAARAYALVGRLNGWFHIGGIPKRLHWLYRERDGTRRLFLRVNQDVAKLGASGAFTARVRVWRRDAGPAPIEFSRAELHDWAILPPHLAFTYKVPDGPDGLPVFTAVAAHLTITVSLNGGPFEVLHGASVGPGSLAGPISQVAVQGNGLSIHRVFWLGKTSGTDYGTRNGHYRFRISLVARGVPITRTVEGPLMWHGERVQCVSYGSGTGRITAIGGTLPGGRRWRLSVPEAIAAIERGESFHVEEPTGDRVGIVVDQTPRGRRFLRTVADGDKPNNLSALPSCP